MSTPTSTRRSAARPAPGRRSAAEPTIEVTQGRRAPYTQLGDWVVLSGVSRAAIALYWALAAHLNPNRVDSTARPSRAVLADILGYAKTESVDPLIRELAALGAIDVEHRRHPDGSPAPNRYVVHETPPDDYTGATSLADYYDRRKTRRTSRSQVPPAPGVPPQTGVGVAHSTRGGVPPCTGHQEDQLQENQDQEPPPTSSTPEPAPSAAQTEQEEAGPHIPEPEATNPAEAHTDDRTPASDTTAAMLVDELPWPHRPDPATRTRLVHAAAACLHRGHTPAATSQHAADGIPGARRPAGSVLARLRTLANQAPATTRQTEGPPRPRRPEHCGTCEPTTRKRETADGRPYPCPDCHPDPERRAAGARVAQAEQTIPPHHGRSATPAHDTA